MSALFESVVNVISRRFRIDRTKVLPNVSFQEIGLDSLSQIELATILQKELGVSISDDDIANMSTVSDVVRWLESQGLAAR
jgi:acyl carrier protein